MYNVLGTSLCWVVPGWTLEGVPFQSESCNSGTVVQTLKGTSQETILSHDKLWNSICRN